MNKLEGFFELQSSGMPTVPWRQFQQGTKLDPSVLWTIRSAVIRGNDLDLPRKIGVPYDEAEAFANNLLKTLGIDNLIIYYPYFIAKKSGVLEVSNDRIVIEAVCDDLWNLVTYNKLDVSMTFRNDSVHISGNENFLSERESQELIMVSGLVKKRYRNILLAGKSLFLEWSFACKSDLYRLPVGNANLIFYELRSVD